MSPERADEVAANLTRLHERIQQACASSDRDPAEITVVAVTKFFPASDVRLLHDLGLRHVGENRLQEATQKSAECADLDLTWHYLGKLQSNKAAAVGRWAGAVHSVDRVKVVAGLDKGAQQREDAEAGPLDVLLQISLDGVFPGEVPSEGDRSGVSPDGVEELATAVLAASRLDLRGVMTVAPRGVEPARAFERLAEVSATVRSLAPEADWVSAGMSADLEAAIICGATHVRVGGALLGNRPLRG